MPETACAPARSTPPVRRRAIIGLALILWLGAFGAGPACAVEPWVETFHLPPFYCRANFALEEHRAIFEELRRLQAELISILGIGPAESPIELTLFRNKSTYRDYLERRFPEVPYRRALFVKSAGRGMVYAYLNREFEVDLRHETTHALLHAVLPTVPLWLDEGLAEYFEVPHEQRAFDNPHLSSVRLGTRFGYVPRVSSLEALEDLGEMGRSEYRSAWAWVHFMMHGPPEAHDELVRFLNELRSGVPTPPLGMRLQHRVPELEERFAQHFNQWKR